MKIFIFIFVSFTLFPQWNQFRGGELSGVAKGHYTWTNRWICQIEKGNSSPIVYGDYVYVTTTIIDTNSSSNSIDNPYCKYINETTLSLVSINRHTGKIVWNKQLWKGIPTEPFHPKNNMASATPMTDGERIYAYFNNIGLFACNNNGDVLWKYQVESSKVMWDWGKSSSPYLYKDKIILVDDNQKQSYIVLLNAKTGEIIWKKNRTEKIGGWSIPVVWENSIRTEIIIPACTGFVKNIYKVRSYDFNGKELWSMGDLSPSMVAQPIVNKDILYIASGHTTQKYRPMSAIKAGASGDITLKSNENKNNYVVWKNTDSTYVPTPVIFNNKIYSLYDNGKFNCLDATTGKEIYAIKFNQPFTASPVIFNNKIMCVSEQGKTFIVDINDRKIQTNYMKDVCLATPALAYNNIFIRGINKIYCIGGKDEE